MQINGDRLESTKSTDREISRTINNKIEYYAYEIYLLLTIKVRAMHCTLVK